MSKLILLILLIGVLIGYTKSIYSQERYFTDFQFAKQIANKLQNGQLEELNIVSAAVVNDQNGYYILIKLSSGETKRLTLDSLYDYSREGTITLADNFVIVISENEEILFFNKNAFHKAAFNADVYLLSENIGDPYEGKNLAFRIQDFNLLDDKINYGSDNAGNRYKYRILLKNGKEVLLSLPQAYKSNNENRFISNYENEGIKALGKLSLIDYLYVRTPIIIPNIGTIIGIEINFSEPVNFNSEAVVFQISKSNNTIDNELYYYFDTYIPNSKIDIDAKSRELNQVGYFRKIELISDPTDRTRVILRCYLKQDDFDFVNEVPQIEIDENQKLIISFTQNVDQISRQFDYVIANQDIQNDIFEISNKTTSYPFYSSFTEALQSINQSLIEEEKLKAIQGLILGLDKLDNVGSLAENDYQLLEVINAKKITRNKIFFYLTDYLEEGLSTPRFNKYEANQILKSVEAMFNSTEQKNILNFYKKQILTP